MASRCFFCGKEKRSGFQISHSHIKSKRTWKPNIQKVRAIVDGVPRRIKVCTRCLKSGKVKRAINA
ncbi:MAG: 50S ribosomal protein L28 [Firmicutes bacterium]|nr:50S ribosomal protein L28 [Bacillota bacterium]